MICVGVGFGSVGGGGLILIGVILVGDDVVSRCSGVGLVFDRGFLCFFFFFFFFLVLTADYGLVVVVVLGVCSAAVVVIVVLEQKERIKNK